ncbi:addiction module antidote protein [Achromobacter dolens]|uniref:addiction module antidote protein n=1 Tax=Achromobacter dolens TaxID=1287738 RepID=UPI003B8353E3
MSRFYAGLHWKLVAWRTETATVSCGSPGRRRPGAKGMTQVAKDAGLSRESLYKALSGERAPDFSTILKVARALGLRLHASAA